jgi:2-polyprenyl-3-methyl-5-hydroxy-6-metoxy-1,4-benzoquinol methylase
LELARFGYDVVGINLSAHCIKIAQDFADLDPHIGERGSLEYKFCNLFKFNPKNKFDVVLFLGALHHFSNQQSVMDSVKRLLKNEGVVIAHEPSRDRVTKGNAVFHDLLLSLLSINNGFFNKQ